MTGLAVQNFLSAATGIAVCIAVIRGFASRGASDLGNFWQDLVRTLFYILVPASFLIALIFVSQGAIQTLSEYVTYPTVTGGEQTLALGPVASQESIKILGTNGGGFFNVNSSMPFENPSGLTNFLQMLMILSIPAGLTATFGRMVGNRRQGWAIYAAMFTMLMVAVAVVYVAETSGTPAQDAAGLAGANLEGKEVRFGQASSALYTVITTVASCGAVTSAHDSLTGIGGLVPLFNMGTGEVDLRRGRLRALRHAAVRPARGVHRGPDGGPHARVPRQEDRGARGEARDDRDARGAPAGALLHGAGHRHEVRRAVDLQPGPAGLLGDPVRLHLPGQQQRLRVRGLHRLRAAQLARATRGRSGSRSPTWSEAWR